MNISAAREFHVYIRVFSKGVYNTRSLVTKIIYASPVQTFVLCVCIFGVFLTNLKWSMLLL